MAASKDRIQWSELPPALRAGIERLVGAPAVAAHNCPGGFSPGLASRLRLADGRRAFVKATDAAAWPHHAPTYRDEARTSASLPPTITAPRLLGMIDEGRWIVLAFEDIDGAEPIQPWRGADLSRVLDAVHQLASAGTPAPVALPRDHPRLGGWAEIAADRSLLATLRQRFAWAADNIGHLMRLDEAGREAARGESLVHFDLYPHNILLTPDRVVFVDWPHARLGAPVVDLVSVLSSVAEAGLDPELILAGHPVGAEVAPTTIDAIAAAQAGFCLGGGLRPAPPGAEAVIEAKLRLGGATVAWLRRRIDGRARPRRTG